MPDYKNRDIDKECPICGGIIWGGGVDVIIEGARMKVCQSCAQHGKKVVHSRKHRPPSRNRQKYSKKKPSQKSRPRKNTYLEPDVVLVDDYNERIKRVRERKNLTQEKFAQNIQEKESLIRRIEQKRTKPTIKLARKIEETYNISLLKKSGSLKVDTSKYTKKRDSGVSLGAFIKRKKDD
jgi:uncharacterized protein (TIGR00270 family)